MTREFTLAQVLRITTGRLLGDIGGYYEILNYMTGDDLFTHVLQRASEACEPEVLRQHPQLADVDASTVTRENWREWLSEQEAKFGATLALTPLPAGAWGSRNPIEEACEMMGEERVIVAITPDLAECN